MTLHLPRQEAVIGRDDVRECASCGAPIDPIVWCAGCIAAGGPCRAPHKRARKRADAAFCDAACKARHRSTFIRDCT